MKQRNGTPGFTGTGPGQGPLEGQPGGKKTSPPLFFRTSLIALGVVILIYFLLLIVDAEGFERALSSAKSILVQVVPVLAVVVLFMAGTNMIPNSILKKHLGGKSGLKGFLVAVLAGTLSHGPAYAWYPFLAELGKKGVSRGRIAAFLYARAVKIPLLAAMVLYFGPSFTVLFTTLIMLGALLTGFLFESMSFEEFQENGQSRNKTGGGER